MNQNAVTSLLASALRTLSKYSLTSEVEAASAEQIVLDLGDAQQDIALALERLSDLCEAIGQAAQQSVQRTHLTARR